MPANENYPKQKKPCCSGRPPKKEPWKKHDMACCKVCYEMPCPQPDHRCEYFVPIKVPGYGPWQAYEQETYNEHRRYEAQKPNHEAYEPYEPKEQHEPRKEKDMKKCPEDQRGCRYPGKKCADERRGHEIDSRWALCRETPNNTCKDEEKPSRPEPVKVDRWEEKPKQARDNGLKDSLSYNQDFQQAYPVDTGMISHWDSRSLENRQNTRADRSYNQAAEQAYYPPTGNADRWEEKPMETPVNYREESFGYSQDQQKSYQLETGIVDHWEEKPAQTQDMNQEENRSYDQYPYPQMPMEYSQDGTCMAYTPDGVWVYYPNKN